MKDEHKKRLKDYYFKFRTSIYNWREYEAAKHDGAKIFEKIAPENSKWMKLYDKIKEPLKQGYDKSSKSLQKFQKSLEKKIKWTDEDEKRVKEILEKKKYYE